MSSNTKKVLKKIGDILVWVILGLAIALAALALISRLGTKEYPTIGKYAFFAVQTESMTGEDGFDQGSLIICKVLSDEEKENLEEGDVITFYIDLDGDGERELNTHRIIKVNKDSNDYPYYTTKGDNNVLQDSSNIFVSDIECEWTGKKLNGVGKFLSFLQSSAGFLVCIVIPMGAFFIYELIAFVLAYVNYKNKKQQEQNPSSSFSKEEEEIIRQRAIEEYLAKQKAAQAENNEVVNETTNKVINNQEQTNQETENNDQVNE